jgi:hypothetical protein
LAKNKSVSLFFYRARDFKESLEKSDKKEKKSCLRAAGFAHV